VDERKTGEKRTGWWSALLKSDVVARGREEKGGGSAWAGLRGGGRRRRGGAWCGDRWARAAPLPHEQGRALGDAGDGVSTIDRRDLGEAGPGGNDQGVREKRESDTGHRWGANIRARAPQCRAARFKPDLKQNLNANGSSNFKLFQSLVD
jgi:hypothetical protein